ncbi:MAG: NAD(P)-binding domain-containing protein [Halioglobus sp.]|jgi:putative flavoprotein involved in K+ transport
MSAGIGRRPFRATTVVIGGGHAGLAVSHSLSARGIDHVVLERGEVANAWRRERWDSLRLLTPNWQCGLPGYPYGGQDPDGFMNAGEVARFICDYARFSAAPLRTHTTVTAVHPMDGGYRVVTSRGHWHCRALVLASGAFNLPAVPALARALPGRVASVTPHQYRNPAQLAPGGVLVVGASATGLQIADEVRRSGRQVVLAVGEHVRMPRRYRGRDIQFWLHATGLLDEHYQAVEDIQRVRKLPSPQLVGDPDGKTLDLNALSGQGVQLVGRLVGIRDELAQFSGSLGNVVKLADLKLDRLLAAIDDWVAREGWAGRVDAPERAAPTRIDASPEMAIDLRRRGIGTVIWATGFRPDYSWLKVPVLDHKGWIRHDGGVADAPGLYVMGLPFMRRRKSSFIWGAADDARDICDHLEALLDERTGERRARVA